MTHWVGIDLGTTNSAICTYDGAALRLLLSPEQHEVTPSAIYVTSRGSRYVGKRAYDQAARSPGNAAILFKRLMGTSTPLALPAVGLTMTPEECAAEILRTLHGYLPEEVRADPAGGTVITVPAAFNQMQKDATMQAAERAGIGKVALMQEPVAAVMSVMRGRADDGTFLVYDLGGGTLDIAIAQSTAGRVGLLAHGGIQMCGGRDFDRLLRDAVVLPWLHEHFDLPEDLEADQRYRTLVRLAEWAAEQAKIELSKKDAAVIALDERELALADRAGKDMYLDIPLPRARFDALIAPMIAESIAAAREALDQAGIAAADVGRIVFVGGPTHYKPLRDVVAAGLGIAPSTEVKPMTAVAEGAALFAESIDWASQTRGRKAARGTVAAGGTLALSLAYQARTPDAKARVAVKLGSPAPGAEIQVDSLDTGWSSGRSPLADGVVIEVPLAKTGENSFKVFVLDVAGAPLALERDRFTVTRTAASVDAIPASHSIGIEVLQRAGGGAELAWLVRAGEQLPKKGKLDLKAGAALRAGSAESLRFKLWEGDILDPIADNRFIGMFEIRGRDFDSGLIATGDRLVCEYQVLDSGNVVLEVTVPSIGGSFRSSRNLYSRSEALRDLTQQAAEVAREVERLGRRIDETATQVQDSRLDQARARVDRAARLRPGDTNAENVGAALQNVHEARRLLAQARRGNLRAIRQLELDGVANFFSQHVRPHARPSEITAFENLVGTAQRAIDSGSPDFEALRGELRERNFTILWRQDWFVIDRFKWLARDTALFRDAAAHQALVARGQAALAKDDIHALRGVVNELDAIRAGGERDDDAMLVLANVMRG